jgi:hypothetical protein
VGAGPRLPQSLRTRHLRQPRGMGRATAGLPGRGPVGSRAARFGSTRSLTGPFRLACPGRRPAAMSASGSSSSATSPAWPAKSAPWSPRATSPWPRPCCRPSAPTSSPLHSVGGFGTGGGIRSDSGSTAPQEIAAWVADNFTATTVGGVTVYDPTTMATTWGRILACPASGWPVSQDDRPQGAPTGVGRADTRPPGRDPRR